MLQFNPFSVAIVTVVSLAAIAPHAGAVTFNGGGGTVPASSSSGVPGIFTSNIVIANPFSISHLKLSIQNLRGATARLRGTLTHLDTGTSVLLFDGIRAGSDFEFNGLESFVNESVAGTWVLRLENLSTTTTATFGSWRLDADLETPTGDTVPGEELFFKLVGRLGPSSGAAEYSNAPFEILLSYGSQEPDLNPTVGRGLYTLRSFVGTVDLNNNLTPFTDAFLRLDPNLTTEASLEVGSTRFRVSGGRPINSSICEPSLFNFEAFFNNVPDPNFIDVVPRTPPNNSTFVRNVNSSNLTLFCQEGRIEVIPIQTLTIVAVPPPKPTPLPDPENRRAMAVYAP